MADRDVYPDEALLKRIFGDNQPASVSIILQHWDKCVFKATLPSSPPNGRHVCIVRFEAQNEDLAAAQFATVAAMQEIAAIFLPGIVPKTLQLGTARNLQGREFQFCVMELVDG